MPDPRPAPAWTTAPCPWPASSRTPAGVSATRYSSDLISVGTPTLIDLLNQLVRHELATAQGQPELDAVAGARQVAARELLDLADPVAQRVAVAVQPPRGRLPLAVALDERLERAHQLAAVVALAALDRREQRLAEQPQRIGVLQREQQLERAQVAECRDAGFRPVAVGAELARLQRAARLVERAAGLPGHRGAAGAGRDGMAKGLLGLGRYAAGELEELVVEEPWQQRADVRALGGDQAADRLLEERFVDDLLAAGQVALPRGQDQRG